MTNTQTDIFSMFNLVDELGEQKKKEEAEKKAQQDAEREAKAAELKAKVEAAREAKVGADATVAKPKEKPEDVFKLTEDTVIRYYGTSYEVTKYFTPEEIAEGLLVKRKDAEDERKPLDGEMLRKRMEKEFPEMVKDHTEMIFLKDKNLVLPTMKAKKKGMMEKELATNSFSSLPLIPYEILHLFIGLAKLYASQELEVHGDIYYNADEKQYFLDIPDQVVNPFWVEVSEDSLSIVNRVHDAFKVLEIHSHHQMQPIPSPQDNSSERVPGMHYAIVGSTENYYPKLTVRQFISDEVGHVKKDLWQIFVDPFQTLPTQLGKIEVQL